MIDAYHVKDAPGDRIEIQFDRDFNLYAEPFTLYYSDISQIDSFLFQEKMNRLIIHLRSPINEFDLLLPYFDTDLRPEINWIKESEDFTITLNEIRGYYDFNDRVRDVFLEPNTYNEKHYLFFAEYDMRTNINENDTIFDILLERVFYRGHLGKNSIVYHDNRNYDSLQCKIDSLFALQISIIKDYYRNDFNLIEEAFFLFSGGQLKKKTDRPDSIPEYYQPDSWHIFLWPEFFFLALENLHANHSLEDILYSYKLIAVLIVMQDIYIESYGRSVIKKEIFKYKFIDIEEIYPDPLNRKTIYDNIIELIGKRQEKLIAIYKPIVGYEPVDNIELLFTEYKLKKIMGELMYKAFFDQF